MAKELMIGSLPFRFRNVGSVSSCGDNVKAAPSLIVEELFCMMNTVDIRITYCREKDNVVMLERRQRARARERQSGVEKQPIQDGIGDNILWIPYGVDCNETFLLEHCFAEDIRASLKLWEVIVWSNRLRFSFCDADDPGHDKHTTRAFVELSGKITLQAMVHTAPFANEPERHLFVCYGDDAADGWGSFVDVATGTKKHGIVKTRFYPEGSMQKFGKIAKDG